jgi:catechol 2,3-dioxygenase-like lactoylglutathione lyase family enzyme
MFAHGDDGWVTESTGDMGRAVRSWGEVALGVNDLEVMRGFYEKVVGLDLIREFPGLPSSGSARDTADPSRSGPGSIATRR